MIFFSRKISLVERNYYTRDEEMLAIIKIFKM
jgi:hypothetical protein